MKYVIAQLSDIHIGGPNEGSGERFTAAVDEINSMTRSPDLVVITGDLTHNGTESELAELKTRLEPLTVPWVAVAGNHDRLLEDVTGHRSMVAGPLFLILLDTQADRFDAEAEAWLEAELLANPDAPTVIALHHPPFETGIWWMDLAGLKGKDVFERVVRRHPQVIKVLSGHVHRVIQTSWDGCSLWVCPSTSISFAGDLDPEHEPAETGEGPSLSLHAYTGQGFVSHVIPVGPAGRRSPLELHAPEFVHWVRSRRAMGSRPAVEDH